MPKYEVGGVASLFPKPEESTTETGKKLQSLFSEFHNKRYKSFSQSPQKHMTKDKKIKVEKQEIENESDSKKKKRTFSSTDMESSVENIIKKFKKENDIEDLNSFAAAEGKRKNNSIDVDFPRRKKKGQKTNFKHPQNNSFVNLDLSRNHQQKQRFPSNTATESSALQDNKPVTNFVRKSKSLEATRGFTRNHNKIASTGNYVEKPKHLFYSDALFEENVKQNVKKKLKNKQKDHNGTLDNNHSLNNESENQNVKKKFKKRKREEFGGFCDNDSSLNKDSKNQKVRKFKNEQKNFDGIVENNPSLNNKSENQSVKKKLKKIKQKEFNDTYDGDSSLNESSENQKVKTEFEKNKQEDFNLSKQKSDLTQFNANEPDFIKLTEAKDEEEVLRRTLFVGNLPTNSSRKALARLFSSFGPVEKVRYFGIETDKNKIYKHGGPKQQNLHYAAESVPGFIVFKERQSAVDALTLSGSVFEGHHITVDFAMPAGSKKLYDEKRSIFIGNLPFDVQDEIIWNAFARCGKIEGVRIVRDRATGLGKGFGYVLFSSVQAKENALQLEDLEIEGRQIRIKVVETGKKTVKKSKKDFGSLNRDSFKSRAIRFKKSHENTNSRKSVKKIMKKNKNKHNKKKIASILQKSMK